MGVREFTDYAERLFGKATDAVSNALAPAVKNMKSKIGSRKVPWMETAKSHLGLKEIRGKRHNKKIIQWAKDFGGWVANYYKTDEIPWCGLFTLHCIMDNGIPVKMKNPLGARNWNKFGFKTTPRYGAIMVFSRKGGGHVGFYVSEDSKTYHILGGNQSNSVNVTKIAKSRFLGARWPHGYQSLHDLHDGRIKRKFAGKLSVNEA